MPRTPGYMDGATPPNYVTRAYAFDSTWMAHAACGGHNRPDSPFEHAWTTDAASVHLIGGRATSGETLIEVALTFCMMCPVQWQCTSWALNVEERTGTWGLRWEDLEWLRSQRNPHQIVGHARHYEIPVQVAVRRRREMTTATKVAACT